MKSLSNAFSYFLLVYAVGMLGWGLLGALEYFAGVVLFMPLQNPTFPPGTQFIHWLLICATGGTYLWGYFTRWPYTPLLMVLIFGMLAAMCFIQTFDFMENAERFRSYAVECTMYVVMGTYLLRAKPMQERFGRVQVAPV